MRATRQVAESALSTPPTSAGLLDLRALVILLCSLVAGFLAAVPAGLAASEHYATSPLTVGLLAGVATFLAVGLSTATALHNLVART